MAHDITGINTNKSSQMGDRSVSSVKKSDTDKKMSQSHMSDTSSHDKVTLTDTAAKLKALEMNLAKQPVVDNNKVHNMQTSIQNGNYKMNPERIADKMISFESAFNDN